MDENAIDEPEPYDGEKPEDAVIRNPTMKDVAREAGVGLKTVSRYVNGETNIAPALSDRIRDAITGLGYRRNLAAASLRPGWTSKTLGLIISDLANPYYSTLTRGIETVARSKGYLLTTASSDEDGQVHDRLVDRLTEERVDGLLIVPPREPARDWAQVVLPIPPLVFLDRPTNFADADCILADNAGGAAAATSALIASGARRIAFIGDSLNIYTMRERYSGYVSAHHVHGLPLDESLVHSNAHSSEQAAVTAGRLLRSSSADAIFAANNRSAVGSLLAFREFGDRLPLIGFDDFEAAQLINPPISVVSQDIALMGRTAAQTLLGRLAGDSSPHRTITLPTSLVLRGSELP